MVVKEYGIENNDIVVLLHGGGLSWWNYKDEINLLKKRFHLIIPVLNGHSESDKSFTSIEDNADDIIKLIDDRFEGKVTLMGGLSLGGQILLEILSKRNDICDYAIIESALAYPLRITYRLIEPSIAASYNLISKKWFSRLEFKSLKINNSLFESYYNDTCNITKQNLIAFMKANASYNIKSSLSDCKAKTLVLAGSRERPIMKKSAYAIQKTIPDSQLEILNGYYHGDISINHADEYVNRVKKLLMSKVSG